MMIIIIIIIITKIILKRIFQLISFVYRVQGCKSNCRNSTIQSLLTALRRNKNKDNNFKVILENIGVKKTTLCDIRAQKL
jgi:hypothetical protein